MCEELVFVSLSENFRRWLPVVAPSVLGTGSMNTHPDDFTETYTHGSLRAYLACAGGRCGMDLTVAPSVEGHPWPAARLEVLRQPRDERGYPAGCVQQL